MALALRVFPALLMCLVPLAAKAAESGGQTWTAETLPNGLEVIYAPMPTSPTTHVRVFYHVGSRDEREDRQGFAHMFEHMMFRGSAHVKPEEHMKLIGGVGGYNNAFTSFDQTVYYETLPANYTELALWLEADRMASFKVSPEIFATERLVVAEEWRMRMNRPYGTQWDDLMPSIFKVHPYRWLPIGNMEQLRQAKAAELQDFFNKFYVPNNAILVVAGNIDLAKTREQVHRFFAWIPGSKDGEVHAFPADGGPHQTFWNPISKDVPKEPPQTAPRRLETTMRVPLPRVVMVYREPRAASLDNDALDLLLSVLGDGRSSRLSRALVTSEKPMCVSADVTRFGLEDGGVMGVEATMLAGKDPAEVEKMVAQQIALLREQPVTPEELEKVKQSQRVAIAERFETAEKVASELGGEMLIWHNLDRVATARERLEAITAADLLRVAKEYLVDNGLTTMVIKPGTPPALPPGAPATTGPAAAANDAAAAAATPVPAANARIVQFPPDYPTTPPMSGTLPQAVFEKGVESTVTLPGSAAPIRVIVMEDHRTPMVHWTLATRSGSYADPKDKTGVGGLTAAMLRRGPKGETYDQFNEALESRAISLDLTDNGDCTYIGGSSLKEQFPYALQAAKRMLLAPAFDAAEFAKLKDQSADRLRVTLTTPAPLAGRILAQALYGETPLGRQTTLESLAGITLEDVKQFYTANYHMDNAIMIIAGDISAADGRRLSENFLAGMPMGPLPPVQMNLPPVPSGRRILLVDLPQSKQSAIRMGIRTYSIQSDEKYAGTLVNQILSGDINSRLVKYVRAEKGYVYGITGIFRPTRQAGVFGTNTDTKFETTADTITASFKVYEDMKAADVTPEELADSKFRVAGGLLMSMETMRDQAGQRITGILNGYPIDYYDKYAQRVGQVTASEVRDVMRKYVDEGKMTIVVVAPAEKVKDQLEKVGPVEVIKPPVVE